MQPYKNLSGNSGVRAYALGQEYIDVAFHTGAIYRYDYESPGAEATEEMKALALAGRGLSTYISQTVGANYAEKLE